MADDEYQVTLEGPDTEGHARRLTFAPESDDEWLREKLGSDGKTRVRIRAADDEDDAEGHAARVSNTLRVIVETDDDTEGHAISIHFPSREEADLFRRRLLATGVLVGAVAIGATAGGALADRASVGGAEGAAAAAASVSGEYAADRGVGIAPAAGAAATGGGEYAADRGVGIAPAAGAAATGVSGEYAADRGVGIAPEAGSATEEEATPSERVDRSEPTPQ